MLKIENLTFAYQAMSDEFVFDLVVAPGEIVLISGKSGAGKSTLLDLVAGFLNPQSGMMKLKQTDLLSLLPEQKPVSILFQEDNLFSHLSVCANLILALSRRDKQQNERKIIQALHDVSLPGFGPRRVQNLSGGQKQRVALARTLLSDRPILLLDEPFTGLDRETANNMRKLVKTLTRKQQWCTIVVSHAEADQHDLADRTYILRENKLEELKTP